MNALQSLGILALWLSVADSEVAAADTQLARPGKANGKQATSSPAGKQATSSERSKPDPIALTPAQAESITRKAQLYGINPNLLRAVLDTELRLGDGQRFEESEQFAWLAENAARVLRHCLDRKRRTDWALHYYAAGSFDPAKVGDRELRITADAVKLFQALEAKQPWTNNSNNNKNNKPSTSK
jgi:hypothetical protein